MATDGLEFCQKVGGGVRRNIGGVRPGYIGELRERTHLNREAKTVVDRAVYKDNLRPTKAKYVQPPAPLPTTNSSRQRQLLMSNPLPACENHTKDATFQSTPVAQNRPELH